MDYPFTTDGCSGGMTWLWKLAFDSDPPWNDKCVEHDKLYWAGGTPKERWQADNKLLNDVTEVGYPIVALLMWIAVRFGGHPLLPFPWRWGYGYKWPRGYD